MKAENFNAAETRPAILQLTEENRFAVCLKEFTMEKEYYSGTYDIQDSVLVPYSNISIRGSFYIRTKDSEDIMYNSFNLVTQLRDSYTTRFQECHILRLLYGHSNRLGIKEAHFQATRMETIKDEEPLLLNLEIPEEISFLERPESLLKKRKVQRLKGRTTKVLAVAKRKLIK